MKTLKELKDKYWELISQEVVSKNPSMAGHYDTPDISKQLDELEREITNHVDYISCKSLKRDG